MSTDSSGSDSKFGNIMVFGIMVSSSHNDHFQRISTALFLPILSSEAEGTCSGFCLPRSVKLTTQEGSLSYCGICPLEYDPSGDGIGFVPFGLLESPGDMVLCLTLGPQCMRESVSCLYRLLSVLYNSRLLWVLCF